MRFTHPVSAYIPYLHLFCSKCKSQITGRRRRTLGKGFSCTEWGLPDDLAAFLSPDSLRDNIEATGETASEKP